jgi:hypothetical protein
LLRQRASFVIDSSLRRALMIGLGWVTALSVATVLLGWFLYTIAGEYAGCPTD